MLEEFLKGYIVEKQNKKTLWKKGGSSNAPASPSPTAKKGKRGRGMTKIPSESNFHQTEGKAFYVPQSRKW